MSLWPEPSQRWAGGWDAIAMGLLHFGRFPPSRRSSSSLSHLLHCVQDGWAPGLTQGQYFRTLGKSLKVKSRFSTSLSVQTWGRSCGGCTGLDLVCISYSKDLAQIFVDLEQTATQDLVTISRVSCSIEVGIRFCCCCCCCFNTDNIYDIDNKMTFVRIIVPSQMHHQFLLSYRSLYKYTPTFKNKTEPGSCL
jgi:hypothetical protein